MQITLDDWQPLRLKSGTPAFQVALGFDIEVDELEQAEEGLDQFVKSGTLTDMIASDSGIKNIRNVDFITNRPRISPVTSASRNITDFPISGLE